MKVLEIDSINPSKIITDFYAKGDFLPTFFDYSYENDFEKRLEELNKRSFQKEALTRHLLTFNEKFNCSMETIINIEKLQESDAVTVVGGQQAGVLTGPLYTIHKIISILKLAKEQEEKLNVPVIPIFWVAGEDHDFDEINHVFSIHSRKVLKRKVKQLNNRKLPVSNLNIDTDSLTNFVINVIRDLDETKITKDLLNSINEAIDNSDTYVDFFCFLIHKLFENTGIVLMDSHNPELRGLEVPFFKQLIHSSASLHECFLEQAAELYDLGYGEPIERSGNNAHLFYHYKDTRLLLELNEEGLYSDRQNICQFTKEQLLELVEKEPYNFSNNVVTRPLMQEFLLPVLAFIGGPGEVAYWATLRKAFHLYDFKVPPVVPRLSITMIEPHIEKWLNEFDLPVETVLKEGNQVAQKNVGFLEDQKQIDEVVHEVLNQFEDIHKPLRELAVNYNKGLEAIALKNELIIKKEISFLAREIEKSVRQKYQHQLMKLELIEMNLCPGRKPQERSLNIVKYLNEYGFGLIRQLIELPLEFNGTHKLVTLSDEK